MKTMPTLETQRLLLRPFAIRDAPEVQRLAGEKAIADTTLAIPHPYENGMAEEWISTHPQEFATGQGVTFAIVSKEGGILVGAISLIRIVPNHQAELGYWVGKPYWKRGFCTEAGKAVLSYAFEKMRLIRIHARHMTRNAASGRVMQKLGMRHEGTLRQQVQKWDVFEDMESYGILKREWEVERRPFICFGVKGSGKRLSWLAEQDRG